ncbi:hypothetical protein PYW07_006235 [Mythimna separata]|uniref:Uncharacterized protein n=1 Tax=Mythimna separata TaxID=271217 RepID=A0AAD8DXG7_MYTSE|nr:hypothetical protein PYW07_006235 [Mythimna separata]
MNPTLFVLDMVEYNQLKVRREFTLVSYMVGLLRGIEHNPGVLQRLSLCVPDRYVWRRRRQPLLAVPVARTNKLAKTPMTRAIRVIYELHVRIDVFLCGSSEFAIIYFML